MSSQKIQKLNRFTTLPILLDLLERKKLTLLNPILWEDKNDSEIILEYKKRKNIKNLFALCFSHNDETIHHWKTFSNGPSGCLIEFDAEKLIAHIKKIPGIKIGRVEYKKINEVQKNKIQLYSNQVFITDDVKEIVPEFLMLLHGIIDSPDIPLNVSRSYHQSDANVKKINTYIFFSLQI